MAPLKIAILVSGRGSNMEAIMLESFKDSSIYEIKAVFSDKFDAPALKKAKDNRIPAIFVNPTTLDKEEYSQKLLNEINRYEIDLIVLAGFMRIIGNVLIKAFPNKIINIHPSILPSFKGLNAQKQAFDYGVKYSGCTVHFVDRGMDTGPIIAQAVVPVKEEDTVETLSHRILKEEHRLYPEVIRKIAAGKVRVEGKRVSILS